MALIGNGLMSAGALVLVITILPLWALLKQLPLGQIRFQWSILAGLVLFFLVSCLGCTCCYWNSAIKALDIVIPALFFVGAVFVFFVTSLSLKTTQDIVKVYALLEESITDPLMGIYNRRYLERRLKEEGLRAKRYGQPLALLLVDIDDFKAVNDTYGHQCGDFVLEQLGQVMLDSIRDSDMVARYGGDEIVILLPNTCDSEAFLFAERLRKIVENQDIALPDKRGERKLSLNITVSIGVAGFNQSCMNSWSFIEHADKALYQAKEKGRNMVVVSDNDLALAA